MLISPSPLDLRATPLVGGFNSRPILPIEIMEFTLTEENDMTLTPAYGRDYKSKAAVLADWDANKDFIIADISSQWDGKSANKADLNGQSGLMIRYQKLTKIMPVTA